MIIKKMLNSNLMLYHCIRKNDSEWRRAVCQFTSLSIFHDMFINITILKVIYYSDVLLMLQ